MQVEHFVYDIVSTEYETNRQGVILLPVYCAPW